MSDAMLAPFTGQQYISLETFKKNGEGVRTPVWFVLEHGVFYVYTEADSWKVKRIRNNPRVRMAACTVRGNVTGPWIEGTASLIEGEERRTADQFLNRKYLLKRLFNWLTRLRGRPRAMIRIVPAPV